MSWTRAEHVVNDVIAAHNRNRIEAEARGEFRAGLSLTRQITDALRREGLLVEDKDP